MNNQVICQSGQKVAVDGWYEVVAGKTPTVLQLISDQLFPNHDGRAVCWHLVKQAQRPNSRELDAKMTRLG